MAPRQRVRAERHRRHGDGWLCRSTNNPGGSPDFYFLVADNKYEAKFG